ncbi:hypothetical protein DXG01_011690 [Tephrocybe rancida]|nr:hypothetical protein DXG01_011690 [Tephrocybe rancida]
MQFSAAVFALAAAAVAFAADLTVLVGDGGLAFNPPSLTAQAGDNVIFEFRAKNHSVTQSTFANPCTYMTTPAPGVDSGFQAVKATAAPFPQWSITIQNASAPLWFFCAQTVPANPALSHCNSGMVFAINPTAEKSFESYQAAAKVATAGAAPPAPAGGASSSIPAGGTFSTPAGGAFSSASVDPAAAAATASGSAFSSAAAGASTPLTFPTSVPATTFSSGAQTSATLAAQLSNPSNSAMHVGVSGSGLVALAGLLAGLML